MELISVIIPTFRRSDMIVRAIESVLNQTYTNFEIIIVDDNDADSEHTKETYERIRHFLDSNKVKYVMHGINRGGSQARNTGIKNSRGKLITFLDDDDEYLPEKLERQLKFYKENFDNYDGFINAQMKVYKNGVYRRTTKSNVDYNNLLFSAVAERIVGTPTLLVPKHQLESIGGFPDLTKGQEWYLTVKLVENGYKFKSMDEAVVKVNIHNNGSIFDGHGSLEKRINGLQTIYSIQKEYFELFTSKQVKEIEYRYKMAIATAHLSQDNKKSLIYFVEALRYKKFDVNSAKFLYKLLFHRKRN